MAALSSVLGRYSRPSRFLPLRILISRRERGFRHSSLDQRIRALFGLSTGQYLTRARIEFACDRLRRTDVAISIVAQECGYADQAAFTRQFHKSVGLTPSRPTMASSQSDLLQSRLRRLTTDPRRR